LTRDDFFCSGSTRGPGPGAAEPLEEAEAVGVGAEVRHQLRHPPVQGPQAVPEAPGPGARDGADGRAGGWHTVCCCY